MPADPPPLTLATAAASWRVDAPGIVLALALAAAYLVSAARVRRAGGRWSWGRTLVFTGAGAGGIVVATCSALAVYRPVLFWPAALANTLLAVVVPIALALGDPVGLARRAWPRRLGPWVWRRVRGRLARAAVFPPVSMALGVGTPFLLYFTPYFEASLRSGWVREASWAQLLGSGLLFMLPILGEDVLPAWCTWPVRAAIAFADGLLDALPGMIIALAPGILTGSWYADHPRAWGPSVHWDQTIGGTLVLTTTEAVGVPLLVAVFVAWARADAAQAREIDARLDAAQVAAAPAAAGPRADPTATGPDAAPGPEDALLQRPWWETEPGGLRGRSLGPRRPPR